jgi:signal transduction histidine kinase
MRENGTLAGGDLEELMRFNETIDQAVAESLERYEEDIDRSKEMFIAILGHDFRSPLGAVVSGSQLLLETAELTPAQIAITNAIVRGGKSVA